jgi:hypothetical protein
LASILPVDILWGFSSPDLPDKKFSFVPGSVVLRRQHQGSAEDRLGGATRAQDLARVAALPLRSLEYPPRDFPGHLFRLRAVDRFWSSSVMVANQDAFPFAKLGERCFRS